MKQLYTKEEVQDINRPWLIAVIILLGVCAINFYNLFQLVDVQNAYIKCAEHNGKVLINFVGGLDDFSSVYCQFDNGTIVNTDSIPFVLNATR